MKKRRYYPDFSIKNVKRYIRSTGREGLVLSCKNSPRGVSPNNRFHRFFALFLSILIVSGAGELGRVFASRFYDTPPYSPPPMTSRLMITLFAFILMALLCYLLIPAAIFLSFFLTKWSPVNPKSGTIYAKNEASIVPLSEDEEEDIKVDDIARDRIKDSFKSSENYPK